MATLRQVNTDNVCQTCDNDASGQTMSCIKCTSSIHVYRCSDAPDLCTETLLKSWDSWRNKYQNIQFICSPCLEILNQETTVADKVANMEGKIISLNQEFLELKQTLQKDAPTPPAKVTLKVDKIAQPAAASAVIELADPVDDTGVNDSGHDGENFQPLSGPDTSRAKKLQKFLENTNLRRCKTVFIMDSNGNGVKGPDLDPDGGCKVITCGGLCIVGAVHALMAYTDTHKNVKKVVLVIGTNDQLHSDEHKPSERIAYIKALYNHAHRIFPYAHVNIVLPFGGTKIDYKSIEALAKDITEADVPIKQYRGPNMRRKLQRDNLHMNAEGKSLFKDFLRSRFIPQKPNTFSSTSGRLNQSIGNVGGGFMNTSHVGGASHGGGGFTHAPNHAQTSVSVAETNTTARGAFNPVVSGPYNQAAPGPYNHVPCAPTRQQTAHNSVPAQPPLAREIAQCVAEIMAPQSQRDRGGPYRTGFSPYGQWQY